MVNILLVHGAWEDGSSWNGVIPALQKAGHTVKAVQLPLTSLADDVALTRRVLATFEGPTVLVGHSYGGTVISNAANGAANATALVYVAALANAEGEAVGDILGRFAAAPGGAGLRPDDQGFLWFAPEHFQAGLAHDVDAALVSVTAVTQKPIAAQCFGDKSGTPAWQNLPSWYIISEGDQMVLPEVQHWMVERMGANVTVRSLQGASHSTPVSQPQAVAEVILDAAKHA
ncbi:MAG TPA: alpha/beta hydrolase [Dictyobacter sp.]|nr:alpha/beta hydrolase [Dictyobacter sp.]